MLHNLAIMLRSLTWEQIRRIDEVPLLGRNRYWRASGGNVQFHTFRPPVTVKCPQPERAIIRTHAVRDDHKIHSANPQELIREAFDVPPLRQHGRRSL
jgi:hypothetical protein